MVIYNNLNEDILKDKKTMKKFCMGWWICNLVIHSIFAIFMSFMAGINIATENSLGLITAIISVGLWLILIIFFDIKGIKRHYNKQK
jgi:hypothetical protein